MRILNSTLVIALSVALAAAVAELVSARARRLRRFSGWAAVVIFVTVTASPLDAVAEQTLSAHMVQHLVLSSVVAPLLVRSRLVGVVSSTAIVVVGRQWPALRSVVTTTLRSTGMNPVRAALLHAAVLIFWHAPVAHEVALASGAVHRLQHLTLVASAYWFWLHLHRRAIRAALETILAAFVAAAPISLLGMLLAFSTRPWYEGYRTVEFLNDSRLTDQQFAGALMWVVGGLPYVLAAARIVVVRLGHPVSVTWAKASHD